MLSGQCCTIRLLFRSELGLGELGSYVINGYLTYPWIKRNVGVCRGKDLTLLLSLSSTKYLWGN